MKRNLLTVLSLLLVVILAIGMVGCKNKNKDATYTVDTSAFNSTVAFGGSIDISGLALVSDGGERVAVTEDMISGIDTTTVGNKTLTVSYGDKTYNVDYSVKYCVTFIIEGVETKQFVLSASEISVPATPVVTGKQFEKWSTAVPNVITGNLTLEAVYKTLNSEREDAFTWSGTGTLNLEGYTVAGAECTYKVTDADGNENGSLATVSIDAVGGVINYQLTGESAVIHFTATAGGVTVGEKSWHIKKATKPTLTIGDGSAAVGIMVGSRRSSQRIVASSDNVSLKYQITTSNANANVDVDDAIDASFLFIDVYKSGVTEIKVTAVNATNPTEKIEATKYVVVTPSSLILANIADEYGIEGMWTIGSESVGGTLAPLRLTYDKNTAGADFMNYIQWVASDSDASVSGGNISLAKSTREPSVVEFKAQFSFMGISVETAPVSIRCVWDGVNVFGYDALYNETKSASPRPIVLQNNIKNDFKLNYTTIKTTYDATHYYNTDQMHKATVKVLLQFKNDVYGNGYEINAHNATIGTLDKTGAFTADTIFRGPLNFVAMSETESSAISVKGQDNICFALYEGVTLNNITLKSCDLIPKDGSIDLTDLDYAGTTVEVLGDNVTIEYSRLMNGRTVLRAFGDYDNSAKKIHLNINNSVLSHAREFIIRMGTNRFVLKDGVASPYLPNDNASLDRFDTKNSYDKMTEAEREEYDSLFINTFVTVKNSVLEEAGIFAIGIDSHFAGEALRDGTQYLGGELLAYWQDLAKTSYGAKLTFEGDVRLYNWKKLSDIDSSTLMENTLDRVTSALAEEIVNMRFDAKTLVEQIYRDSFTDPGKVEFRNVVEDVNGELYVHNGIAFFGGGKNYGVFENNISGDFNHAFSTYSVSLGQLTDENGRNQGYLRHAAGDEPFYFVLYNAESTFGYAEQVAISASANKYACLYK